MKILVSGASGFLGNYVIKELLKHDFNVVATAIENANNLKFKWLKKVEYIQADINTPVKNWHRYFHEPDIIIHLAWQGLPNYKEMFHLEQNLPNNYLFLKNLLDNGLKKIVGIGTCLEYGMQSGALKEDMETIPNNPYAQAKDVLRKKIDVLNHEMDFSFKWIRLFYIYGKGQNPNSILSQLDKALLKKEKKLNMSGGEQLRDYLEVKKAAEYIVKIATQNEVTGVINCCSGKPITIKNLVENHLKNKNKQIELNLGYYPYPDWEPMAFWGDTSKLNKILNIK